MCRPRGQLSGDVAAAAVALRFAAAGGPSAGPGHPGGSPTSASAPTRVPANPGGFADERQRAHPG
jgi:hypothetical protein